MTEKDQELQDQFDQEWLAFAKKSIIRGIVLFTIPLSFIFHVFVDRDVASNSSGPLFLLRTLSIPLTIFLVFTVNKIKTKKFFLIWYIGVVQFYSFWIIAISRYLTPGSYNLHMTGCLVILIGGFSFFPVPRLYYFINAFLIIALPSLITAFFSPQTLTSDTFKLLIGNVLSIFIMFEFARKNMWNFQKSEFDLKSRLKTVLEDRESDVKRLANELAEAKLNEQKIVDEKNRMDDLYKLARQVSHDIRSPLTALSIVAKKIDVHRTEEKKLILSATERIESIAESLLKKFKKDNRSRSSLKTINLSTILKSVYDEKYIQIENQKLDINLTLNLADDPLSCAGDEHELARVFSNLIQNAIEAIPQNKKGVVTIGAKKDLASDQVIVEITDNGVGIPKEHLDKLGQYGFTYGKKDGAGIGLAHAFKVISSDGGAISIKMLGNITYINVLLR